MPNANAELHKVNQVYSNIFFFFQEKKESNELSPSSSSSNLEFFFFWPAIAMHQGLWKFSRYFPLIF